MSAGAGADLPDGISSAVSRGTAIADRGVERSVVVVGDTSSIAPRPISLGGMSGGKAVAKICMEGEAGKLKFEIAKWKSSEEVIVELKNHPVQKPLHQLPAFGHHEITDAASSQKSTVESTQKDKLVDKLKSHPVQKPLRQLPAFGHHELRDAASSQKISNLGKFGYFVFQ
uniref:Uncharacterized protein n=1 Tax=Solanum lycopersicum TaxID=4081 RepID=A0A3Q7EQD6_SOLLC